MATERQYYRTCNLCEAMCGLEITVRGNDIVRIEGDRQDPFSQGYICPKGVALQDLHTDPNRLRHPVRRTRGGAWERITWEAAFDEVAGRLRDIQERCGNNAVATYQGNPAVHNFGTVLSFPSFVRTLKTRNIYSASSVDQLPHIVAAHAMFGHGLLLPVPDVERTQFFLIMGANPVVSNGSLMTAPGMSRRLQALRARGGRVVVVDPRRTETAELADQHLFIRPGTDAYLLLAMLHVLFAEGRVRLGRLAAFTDGVETLAAIVRDFPPARVAPLTGIAAETIEALAREFAAAPAAVCYGRVGLSIQTFGTSAQWLVNALNIVTGNLDREGGAMFPKAALDPLERFTAGHLGAWKSRVRGLPEFAGELPVAALAEEILTPGKGQIRALVTIAGNPVLSTPNGRQLDAALATLEFMAAVDIYINETTRHAHIILPPTGSLEHENYAAIFHHLAVRNTVKYSPAVFAPADDTRHDWQIFLELETRLASRTPLEAIRAQLRRGVRLGLGLDGMLDLAFRFGPYGTGLFGDGLTLAKVKAAPHGIDLGPLQPALPGRLWTKNRRIALAPEMLTQDVPRLQAQLQSQPMPPAANGMLLLIGRRQLRSNNSWMHNSERLVRGKARCTLLVHPDDARRYGITSGQMVKVMSRAGEITAPAEVSDEVMPGVVSLPHGWGHDRPGVQLDVARRYPGVSINDITDEQLVDEVSGNAALSGVPVRLAPVAGKAVSRPA
ncbi:molybdopterin oxidoreductase family protein [Chloracidobacterium sp. MS 40/45]|uniref:molybdopterin oxidoreductase family protein n=1 Tax=Chloracidobacterium aggregatum TaxID=2851959 RepID=UPI001B8CB89B|nr:molybdopterin oxidoreductase family protein [Chloracidobacterium aggregatum]QUW00603.1 molybdopterin oxidoreductase family protein [Chloracidobacterium sp. MS 40/45]